MRGLPGEPGDYVWIAVGLAMILAGLVPLLGGTDDGGTTTHAQDGQDADQGGSTVTLPTTAAGPARTPLPTLPDLTEPPLPPPNGTLA